MCLRWRCVRVTWRTFLAWICWIPAGIGHCIIMSRQSLAAILKIQYGSVMSWFLFDHDGSCDLHWMRIEEERQYLLGLGFVAMKECYNRSNFLFGASPDSRYPASLWSSQLQIWKTDFWLTGVTTGPRSRAVSKGAGFIVNWYACC
jgi:hypothetical protein